MRVYILISVVFVLIIGAGFAVNVDIGDVEGFKQALEQDGFTIQEGKVGPVDLIKMYEIGYFPTAAGNNPTTKYLGYFVPTAPGNALDPELAE
mgnify:CR=1 FL=1|jgi:hypothetical protein